MFNAIAAAIGLVLGILIGYVLGRRPAPSADRAAIGAEDQRRAEDVEPLAPAGGESAAEAEQLPSSEDGTAARLAELEEQLQSSGSRVSELETELRRLRRRAGDHFTTVATNLSATWQRHKLPRHPHEIEGEIKPEVLAELDEVAGRARSWMRDFSLGDAEVHYHLGLVAVAAGRIEEALDCFEKAAFDGLVPDSWLAAGDCQWQLRRPKKAAARYQRCLEHKRMPEHIFHRCAEVAVNERRYADALAILKKVMSRKNPASEAYVLAAAAHLGLGEDEQAVALCEQGLVEHPEAVKLLTRMIQPLARLGRHEELDECAERARELDPENPELPYALGAVRLADERVSEAAELFEEALILRSEYPEALCAMGTIHNRAGEFKKALDCFLPAVELKPDFAEAYFHMKESYEGLRDFDNAIAMLNKAVQLNPDYA